MFQGRRKIHLHKHEKYKKEQKDIIVALKERSMVIPSMQLQFPFFLDKIIELIS